jgi:hypothetical protein
MMRLQEKLLNNLEAAEKGDSPILKKIKTKEHSLKGGSRGEKSQDDLGSPY